MKEKDIVDLIEHYKMTRGIDKERLIRKVYQEFITPREFEFRKNYEENRKYDFFNSIAYEELPLDFICIEDEKYYIYDKDEKEFIGVVDLKKKQFERKTAKNVFIADTWDVRIIIDIICKKQWNKIYLYLNTNLNKFLSFFKLPQVANKYFSNAKIFETVESITAYFEQNDSEYIPKKIYAYNKEAYEKVFEDVHRVRISKENLNAEKILLSICIPSYNRGSLALEAVETILKSKYDAEIEIIVSNNGSEIEKEGYEVIKNIQDSRIKYYEFDTTQGYQKNVMNVLSHSKGKFAVLSSDEDRLLVENLEEFLDFIVEHMDIGFMTTSVKGIGANLHGEKRFEKGVEALTKVINSKYLTGISINLQKMRDNKVLEKALKMRENEFCEFYLPNYIAVLTSLNTDTYTSGIALWEHKKDAEFAQDYIGADTKIRYFTTLESRIKQLDSMLEILNILLGNKSEFEEMFVYFVKRTYKMMKGLVCMIPAYMYNQHSWQEICFQLLKNSMKLADKYSGNIVDIEGLKKKIEESFLQNLEDAEICEILKCQERLELQVLSKIIKFKYEIGVDLMQLNFEEIEEKVDNVILSIV